MQLSLNDLYEVKVNSPGFRLFRRDIIIYYILCVMRKFRITLYFNA